MTPHELIHELVARAGGSLRVAKAMGSPSFQGTLYKIAHGQVLEPTHETASRIASHFGIPVEALYSTEVATQVAAERLMPPMPSITDGPPELTAEDVEAIYRKLSLAEQRRFLLSVISELVGRR
jgi:transcriptional regulator with XRE-family HTH domain